MERDSRSGGQEKASLEELVRERVREIIEVIVEQELEEALGAASSARVGAQRSGYRHGHRVRTLSTSLGASSIALPRARMEGADGKRHEWRSAIIPRYQRRTAQVDEAILGIYLSGTNTRRLRGGAGSAAARDPVVERRGIASGGTVTGGLCRLGRTRLERA
jgi:putative transposase